jgi:hypothetical protein
MKHLNDLENFTKGEWQDQNIWDVADEDPGYIQRLLSNGRVESDEAALFRAALGLPEEE